MHYWKRPAEPQELKNQREAFTKAWKDECAARLAARLDGQKRKEVEFKWPKVRNDEGIEETLQERLYRITDNHCAYCDNTVQPASNVTIDHFKEKVGFEDDAYAWENLYACCGVCQARGKWHADVLRPDADGYSFYQYFRYTHDGRIRNVCKAGTEEHRRAEKTLEVLKLNREKLREDREKVFGQYSKPRPYPLLKPMDPATAVRLLAHRPPDDVTRRPYRDWYLREQQAGIICCCRGCEERRK